MTLKEYDCDVDTAMYIFAETVSYLLKEGEGIVVDYSGQLVIVGRKEDTVFIYENSGNDLVGQLVWL
jgi:hypothetical protein